MLAWANRETVAKTHTHTHARYKPRAAALSSKACSMCSLSFPQHQPSAMSPDNSERRENSAPCHALLLFSSRTTSELFKTRTVHVDEQLARQSLHFITLFSPSRRTSFHPNVCVCVCRSKDGFLQSCSMMASSRRWTRRCTKSRSNRSSDSHK